MLPASERGPGPSSRAFTSNKTSTSTPAGQESEMSFSSMSVHLPGGVLADRQTPDILVGTQFIDRDMYFTQPGRLIG